MIIFFSFIKYKTKYINGNIIHKISKNIKFKSIVSDMKQQNESIVIEKYKDKMDLSTMFFTIILFEMIMKQAKQKNKIAIKIIIFSLKVKCNKNYFFR